LSVLIRGARRAADARKEEMVGRALDAEASVADLLRDNQASGKVPYYTASHTNRHTTLHLNKNREDLRQRKFHDTSRSRSRAVP
jgi:hypothetical protein